MRQTVKIGVLSRHSKAQAAKRWQPTADYLSAEIPGYEFVLILLDFQEIAGVMARGEVEFAIADAGMYAEFEALYGANRLATLKTLRMGQSYTVVGGVIFCRSDRADINQLTDLRGQRFMAVAENSLAGWRAAWREMKEVDLNPYRDFQSLQFGGSYDAVVYGVQNGEVDAGTVGCDTLERMTAAGQIQLDTFKIIHQQTQFQAEFPFALSTRLYPEWPFIAAKHVPTQLAEQVAIALLKMPQDSVAAQTANCAGWTVPLNYQPVRECFEQLQIPPYDTFSKNRFELAVRGSNDGLWDWDIDTNEVLFSSRWKTMLGYAEDEIVPHFQEWEKRLHPEDRDRVLAHLKQILASRRTDFELEYRLQHRDGSYRWILCRALLLRDLHGKPYQMAGSHSDITTRKQAEAELKQSELCLKEKTRDLEQALQELQETYLQLIHTEKMSSLGQLVAGIAHEINNPINFIYGNLKYTQQSIDDLVEFVQLSQKYCLPHQAELAEKAEEVDLDFVITDLSKMLNSMKMGADRIRKMVLSLRNFSRLDEAELKAIDVHEGLENTLLLLQHRLKPHPGHREIKIKCDYSELPLVECYAGQINQVFMNILSNAIDAVDFQAQQLNWQNQQDWQPTITIRTESTPETVIVAIADNGTGINEVVKQRLFDPFFTTKPVGQGQGLGLSISYKIVVEQHRGTLTYHSQEGQGAEFRIEIPLMQQRWKPPAPNTIQQAQMLKPEYQVLG